MRQFTMLSLFITGLFVISCHTGYQTQQVQYNGYMITDSVKKSDALTALIRPYADSVNKSMSGVVAISSMELEKKQPESTLGNVLADAMLYTARDKFNINVDAAFVNYGGVRLNSIPAGNITLGKIYEVAPFDNAVVLQKLDGKTFRAFLDHISGRGGWPCAGISFRIKDKKAIDIMVNGRPFDENATYIVANSDYVANGGDDCAMLRSIPMQNINLVFRDALVIYFGKQHREGKMISAKIENRVSNAQ